MKKAGLLFLVMIVIAVVAAGIGYWKSKNYYRPRDAEVAKKYENAFPKLKLFTIDEEFGGCTKAQKEHVANGGTFDQISNR